MYKLGQFVSGEWIEHAHSPIFHREETSSGTTRLRIGVPAGDTAIAGSLAQCLEPPLLLLYVLHTARGEGALGRYQSPLLEFEQIRAFLQRFSAFLGSDSRFDLWFYSPSSKATVVWDRHNIAYAYGPVACFEGKLNALGFTAGTPSIPVPHEHHYHAANDADAKALLDHFSWQRSDLRPEDEQ